MAGPHQRKQPQLHIEAARAALVALHAATGLAAAHSRVATKALRAAEGLCRSAIAVMADCATSSPEKPVQTAATGDAVKCRRRPKRSKKKQEDMVDIPENKLSIDAPRAVGMTVDEQVAVHHGAACGPAASAAEPQTAALTCKVGTNVTLHHRCGKTLTGTVTKLVMDDDEGDFILLTGGGKKSCQGRSRGGNSSGGSTWMCKFAEIVPG